MPVRLIDSIATTRALAELFSDESLLKAMLEFEVGLAAVEASLGIVPEGAARQIATVASSSAFDTQALADQTLRAGTPGIPVVKALTESVRRVDANAAGYVHWGATSQDVADTALVLLLKRAQVLIDADLSALEEALRKLAANHGDTAMLGRTLLQAGPPITFQLKIAGWLAALRRGRVRLKNSFLQALVLQFGGATGTLGALGQNGDAVGRSLAERLGLTYPDAPWHSHRDRLGELVCGCGVLVGSLGKMARDVSLLMQTEVAEAAEPGGAGRGGSSTMPHKRNPISCAVTLAAANRVPGMVAAFLSGMVQEHERGLGGWQAEWPTIASVIQATGVAVASMREAAEGLTVDKARMLQNIYSTKGVIFAERGMMLLGEKIGRDRAHHILEEATRTCVRENRSLSDVLAGMPEVAKSLDAEALRQLDIPEQYLGSSKIFAKRLLAADTNKKSEKP